MVKAKGRLGKNEKYIIEGMFEDGHSFEEIAEAIDRKAATVEKHIRSISEAEAEAVEEGEPTKRKKAKAPMIRRTVSGKEGVSIMTDAASTISDLNRNKPSTIKKRYEGTIHKISDD